jgi:hypothetical protein
VGVTFGAALLLIVLDSPRHGYDDTLFWFMCLGSVGLLFLCIILHEEKEQEVKTAIFRLAVLVVWAVAVVQAMEVI